MYCFISKKEYFDWQDLALFFDQRPRLKSIQDSYALSKLMNVQDWKIAEIGGGNSRVLQKIRHKNECWNIDRFEGEGQGPTDVMNQEDVTLAKVYLGEFSDNLPENYFDCVFSISVVEHIARDQLSKFFLDIQRILKPGGLCFHAIDCYLGDEVSEDPSWMEYHRTVLNSCSLLKLVEQPAVDEKAIFRSWMASDSDINMWRRNNLLPRLRDKRAAMQCVSLKAEWKKIDQERSGDDCVYIYSMGKVGSASIGKTLRESGYGTRHFHYLRGDYNPGKQSAQSLTGLAQLSERKAKIISLTRDPIARNISAFFQNLEMFVRDESEMSDVPLLLRVFRDKYNHDIPLEWFDMEFKEGTGIDVFRGRFHQDKGYMLVEKGGLEVLIIKSEASDKMKIEGLKSLLRDESAPDRLLLSNRAEEKAYAVVYQKFLSELTLDREYIERMYESKYARFFYTEKELQSFRKRWEK